MTTMCCHMKITAATGEFSIRWLQFIQMQNCSILNSVCNA